MTKSTTKKVKGINKKEVLEAMVSKAQVEVIQQEAMISFYANAEKEATTEEAKNQYKIKQSQMQSTVDFNKKFIEYVQSL